MSNNIFKKLAARYNTPVKVQRLLRSFDYNSEKAGETLKSAERTFRTRNAHCLEGAFLAAAILEQCGFPPLVMSIESQDDLDHVIFVYKEKGRWGSVARSRDIGLHGRRPVYRSLRDLALSYYEPYIDKTGCVTGFGLAHLDDAGCDWRHSKKNVWKAERFLIDLKHQNFRYNKKRYARLHRRYLRGEAATEHKNWI